MIKQILSSPFIYSLYHRLLYKKYWKIRYINRFIKPRPDDTILDVGCGPCDILNFLPEVRYTGVDVSLSYIEAAEKKFKGQGTFISGKFCREIIGDNASFDIILASGLLHHLDDGEAGGLFAISRAVLKPGGRLITLDGCWIEGQPWINRFLNTHDRGRFIRSQGEYLGLATPWFSRVKPTIVKDATILPYHLFIMECFG